MNPSQRIIDFIKGFEKLRLSPYMPTENDRPTIGWGSTGADITMFTLPWTIPQADERFANDLERFGGIVDIAVAGAPTSQNQFDAMVSLAYNIGATNFRQSSVLTNHRAGHYQTAAWAFSLWDKQRNKSTNVLEVVNGLVARRAAEARIYSES